MNKEIIVQIQGLSKTINRMPILSDFGMVVYRGDICAVVGPNDSGKTVLLRTMTTLINADKGKIEIFGKSLTLNRKDILKRTGLMIDEPVFYNHLNAFDNLTVFTRYAGFSKDNDEINRVLKLTGLLELSTTKLKYFASGDRKRLGIALAIFYNPELVILDEPFRGLDMKGVLEIKDLIRTLNEDRGITFLITTKRVDELEGFISRLVLIDGGHLISEGNVDELTGRAKVVLSIETGNNSKALEILKNSSLDIDNITTEGELLRIGCEKKVIPLINKYLIEADIQIFRLQPDNAISSYYLTFTD